MSTKKQVKSEKTSKKIGAGFYKGYDIGWLRKKEDHPDYYLVAEYDNKGKKKASKSKPDAEAEPKVEADAKPEKKKKKKRK